MPNYGSKEKFGARADLRNVLQEKLRGRGGSSCRFDRLQKTNLSNNLWTVQHRWVEVEPTFTSETRTRRVKDKQTIRGKAQVAGRYLTGSHGDIVGEG